MDYNVKLEQSTGRPVAVVRCKAELSELSKVVPAACGTVWEAVRDKKITGAGRNLAIYLDDEINLEVGVELGTPLVAKGVITSSTIPAGPVATAVHVGPYNLLAEAHQAIRQWCDNHGFKRAGPNWEIYGHWESDWNTHPEKIRTEVFYLLEKE